MRKTFSGEGKETDMAVREEATAARESAAAEFSWREGLALCFGYIAFQFLSELLYGWGTYFYSPSEGGRRVIYTSVALIAAAFIVGNTVEAFANPFIGAWSDKTSTQPGRWRFPRIRGRRRPFVFWGSILSTVTAIAFWFPPVQGQNTLNFVYATAILCLHWFVFTICVVPVNALGPELARSQQARVKMGIWVAVGLILGLGIVNIVPGLLIPVLDPARELGPVVPEAAKAAKAMYSPLGYQRVSILFTLAALVLLQFVVWNVRERYDSSGRPEETPALRKFLEAIQNRMLILYVSAVALFHVGLLGVQRVVPYYAEVILGGDESTVSLLMGGFLCGAISAYFVVPSLSKRYALKWIWFGAFVLMGLAMPVMYLVGVSGLSHHARTVITLVVFSISGIGQGLMYVLLTPLLGEIIDYDEMKSGERREAVYNGLSNFAFKFAQMFGVALAGISMQLWGNSVEHPMGILMVGPIAGIFGVMGLVVVWFYPVFNVTPSGGKAKG